MNDYGIDLESLIKISVCMLFIDNAAPSLVSFLLYLMVIGPPVMTFHIGGRNGFFRGCGNTDWWCGLFLLFSPLKGIMMVTGMVSRMFITGVMSSRRLAVTYPFSWGFGAFGE